MANLRKAVLLALQQLIKGKSFLQALLTYWISPRHKDFQSSPDHPNVHSAPKTAKQFLRELEEALVGRVQHDGLKTLSNGLKAQFRDRLHLVGENMLPSFNHLLPTGDEVGEYLALDVGGSTLRVALVHLRGRSMAARETEIAHISSFKITPEIKQLEGLAFFDWMAERIHEVLGAGRENSRDEIRLGLAWSFPIDQISPSGALLMGMGKGFMATRGLMGQDLGEIIRFSCGRRGLNVRLGAIVNDGSATLLSQAYVRESTYFGLILGTGSNMSVHLPVSALGRAKYGRRPDSWFAAATHVIVNTEISMFGKGFLPMTRWDDLLNEDHPRPDFQPLEHLVAGYYLGEICRLVLVEAIQCCGIFGGEVPSSLEKPNSLDTATISKLESDTTPGLETGLPYFLSHHDFRSKPTLEDVHFLRSIAAMVSRRAAAIIATCVFSLWELRYETEAEDRAKLPYRKRTTSSASRARPALPKESTVSSSDERPAALESPPTPPEEREISFSSSAPPQAYRPKHTTVAYNGSVIEHYPGLRVACQAYLDELVASSSIYDGTASVELVPTTESSLLGAAVALACATEEECKLDANATAADGTDIARA